MLIPQFSLRWMLAVTGVLAVVCLILAQAVDGSSWAVGVTLALVVLAGTMLMHGLLFFLVWVFALLTERRRQRRGAAPPLAADLVPSAIGSPFAAATRISSTLPSSTLPAVTRAEAD